MRRLLPLLVLGTGLRAAEEGVSPAAAPLVDQETLAAPLTASAAAGFSGDLRVRLRDARPRSSAYDAAPPDLRHRPYFSQRLRARWGARAAAGFTAVRPVPGPSLAAGDWARAGIVKGYVQLPGRWIAGDYVLSYGQGLLFYDGLGEFVRPAWAEGRGAAPDLSAARAVGLRGAAWRAEGGRWRLDLFGSRRGLDLPVDAAGRAAADLLSLREAALADDEEGLASLSSTEETLAGARWELSGPAARAAATVASTRFSRAVAPPDGNFGAVPSFTGRRHLLWGADAALRRETWRAAADAAVSADERGRAAAWAATVWRDLPGGAAWFSLHGAGAGYFARHGKGPAFEAAGGGGAGQRGLQAGLRWSQRGAAVEGEAAWVRFPRGAGNGVNEEPVFPSAARRWRLEGDWRAAPRWTLSAGFQSRARERYAAPAGGGPRRQGGETTRRARLESLWEASSRWRFRARHDVRWERAAFIGRRAEGRLVMGEARRAFRSGSVAARWYAWRSPRAYLTTGVEEIWDGVAAPRLAAGMSSLRGGAGERYALVARRRWSRLSAWAKYDADLRESAEGVSSRHAWHFQMDFTL